MDEKSPKPHSSKRRAFIVSSLSALIGFLLTGCRFDQQHHSEVPRAGDTGTPVASPEIPPTPTAPTPAEAIGLVSKGDVVITETIKTDAEQYTINAGDLNRLELNQELPLVIESPTFGRIELVIRRTSVGEKRNDNSETLSIFQVYPKGKESSPLVALATYLNGDFGLPSTYFDNLRTFGTNYRLNFDSPEDPTTHKLSSVFNIYVMSRTTRGSTIIEPSNK